MCISQSAYYGGKVVQLQVDVMVHITGFLSDSEEVILLWGNALLLKKSIAVPWGLSRLTIWHCHCSSLFCCCGTSSIPGSGTSVCCGCGFGLCDLWAPIYMCLKLHLSGDFFFIQATCHSFLFLLFIPPILTQLTE